MKKALLLVNQHARSGQKLLSQAIVQLQELGFELIEASPDRPMRQGNHATWPGVRALQGQEIEVHTVKSRHINTDGEITTQTPAIFRVIPKALAVFAP